jgi:hypothetical protein
MGSLFCFCSVVVLSRSFFLSLNHNNENKKRNRGTTVVGFDVDGSDGKAYAPGK